MTSWSLPEVTVIGGTEYAINADFRDVLEVIEIMQDPERDAYTRMYVALALFYEDFDQMPKCCYREATEWMMDFIDLGEPDDGRPRPKTIDWVQDQMMIAAEVSKVAGTEVRTLEFLHWWTFIGYFYAIGEGQLSFIVSIREKLRKGKQLEKHEREFYRDNRARVDFNRKLTKTEQTTLDKWLGK